MQLGEFVKRSLGEIILGVSEAKILTRNLASVSPGSLNSERLTEKTEIEFEVALTTKKIDETNATGSTSGGFQIAVLSARAGIDGDHETEDSNIRHDESVSRVSFTVPVYLNAHHRDDDGPDPDETLHIEELKKNLGY